MRKRDHLTSGLISAFEALLDRADVTEQNCQDFLERHTELIYTPFLQNHWVNLECLISKFPLDTSLVTDLAYLTGSSYAWHLVLVEFEHPQKFLFRRNSTRITPSAELTKAIAQIHSWRDLLRTGLPQVLERLRPLMGRQSRNPVTPKYLLVMGRRRELEASERRRDRLKTLGDADFEICTYDSFISHYQKGPALPTNVIQLAGTRFRLKCLNKPPQDLFAHLTPEELIINPSQRDLLTANGYEMEQWESGRLLTTNGKLAGISLERLEKTDPRDTWVVPPCDEA